MDDNPQLKQAKEDIEPKIAGLQALMAITTDTETRDALQAEVSELSTKLGQINTAMASTEATKNAMDNIKDMKEEKVQVSEQVMTKLQTDVKNIQAAMTLFETKIEKVELTKEDNLSSPTSTSPPGTIPTSTSPTTPTAGTTTPPSAPHTRRG